MNVPDRSGEHNLAKFSTMSIRLFERFEQSRVYKKLDAILIR